MQFLIEANKENTLIATNWEYASKLYKNRIIADIVRKEGVEKGVTFDFLPSKKHGGMFKGYSKELSANIVLKTLQNGMFV